MPIVMSNASNPFKNNFCFLLWENSNGVTVFISHRKSIDYYYCEWIHWKTDVAQISFIQALINGTTSCPSLLSRISFKIPQRRTRNLILIKTTFLNDPLNLMIRKYNLYINYCDSNQSCDTVKLKLKNYLLCHLN